jgi:hypothetical protein
MARRRRHVQQLLRRIEDLNEIEQCELLEQMLLRHRSTEAAWDLIWQVRAKLPRCSEREVKRDVDAALREVRREFSRSTRP